MPHNPPALFNRATLAELMRLALPMVVSQGAFAVMVVVDRYFMAQLSTAHIAAALGGGVASFFSFTLFQSIIAYANALVAQYFGAGQWHQCSKVTTQGAIIALLSLPLLIPIALGVDSLFSRIGHAPAQVALERQYYLILMLGAGFVLLKTALASFFTGVGRTRVVMVCDVSGVVINIPLSYILVFGKLGMPAMGIVGAAWGTVCSTLFALALFLAFYLHKDNRLRFQVAKSLVLDAGILRRYLRLGAPSGVESFLNIATFNLFLLMFQAYGVAQGAAIAIVFNWDMVSFVPLLGLHIAVMSLIGRFVGSGDLSKANQVMAAGFVVALVYSGTLAVIFVVFRQELVQVYATPDADFSVVLALGSAMMVGMASYVMADAINLVASGVLRGAGDTRWLMITSTGLHWLMLVAQYFIIKVLHWGPLASWWAFVAMLFALALVYVWRLRSGIWRQPERLAAVMHT